MNALTCLAAKGVLDIVQDETPSVTRNLLLQTPRKDSQALNGCAVGEGCLNACSGHGYCQSKVCMCETNYWGSSCHTTEFGAHCDDGYAFVPYTLYDTRAEPWRGADFRLYSLADETGVVTSSMCGGRNETSGACLALDTAYGLMMTSGSLGSAHMGYEVCGVFGGAPSIQTLRIEADGSCSLVCPSAFLRVDLGLIAGSGWRNGYYQIMDGDSGAIYAGGTLVGAHASESHFICAGAMVRPVLIVAKSAGSGGGGSWELCGHRGTSVDDFALFDLSSGKCLLRPIAESAALSNYGLGEFSYSGSGWGSEWLNIVANSSKTSATVATAYLTSGAANQSTYHIAPTHASWYARPSSPLGLDEDRFFVTCGARGALGEAFKFKASADAAHGCERDCMWLRATPQLKPAAFDLLTIAKQAFPHELVEVRMLDADFNLCLGNSTETQAVSCYRLILGAGSVISQPTWSLCGASFPSNAVVDVCVSDWTACNSSVVHAPACVPSAKGTRLNGLLILLYDETGAGWGGAEYFVLSVGDIIASLSPGDDDDSNDDGGNDDGTPRPSAPPTPFRRYAARGQLSAGFTGYDSLCLADGCYAISVSPGADRSHASAIAWILCGHIGQAGEMFFFQVRPSALHASCVKL